MRCIAIVLLCLASCQGIQTEVCSDDRLCAPGLTCDDAHGLCVFPEQVSACAGEPDDLACSFGGISGRCDTGVCFGDECGDGVRGPSEPCDDRNTEGGDGCSADCRSNETCGNGFLDPWEECDCGSEQSPAVGCASYNSDAAGAECRSDCVVHCGDGVVNAAEDCDSGPPRILCRTLGFDYGALSCGAECRNSLAPCGNLGFAHRSGMPAVLVAVYQLLFNQWFYGGWEDVAEGQPGELWAIATDPYAYDEYTVNYRAGIAHYKYGWTVDYLAGSGLGLYGIASDRDTAVAVGCYYQPHVWTFPVPPSGCSYGRALVHRPDQDWQEIDFPEQIPPLTDVHAATSGDFVAVGGDTIVRGDGTSLTVVHTEADTVLRAVSSSGPSDIVVVGKRLASGVALHFDGGTWNDMSTGLDQDLRSVDVDGETVIAGAVDGDVYVYNRSQATWSRLESRLGFSAEGVLVLPSGGIFAVGANGLAAMVDSSGGRRVETGITFPVPWGFRGAARTSMGVVAVERNSGLYLFGGTARSLRVFPGLATEAQGVWRSPSGLTYAVGGDQVAIDQDGVAEIFDLPTSSATTRIWGRSDSSVFAVGEDGLFLAFDGDQWSEPCPDFTSATLNDVFGSQDDVFAVGDDGAAFAFNGTSCTDLSDASGIPLTGVWGTSRDDLITVSTSGAVSIYDGAGWTVVDTLDVPLRDVWGASADDVWVVGDEGRVYRRLSQGWQSEPSYALGSLRTIDGDGPSDVWAGSATGEVIHWDGNSWSPVPLDLIEVSSLSVTEERVTLVGNGWYDVLRGQPWWQSPP